MNEGKIQNGSLSLDPEIAEVFNRDEVTPVLQVNYPGLRYPDVLENISLRPVLRKLYE